MEKKTKPTSAKPSKKPAKMKDLSVKAPNSVKGGRVQYNLDPPDKKSTGPLN